MADRRRSRLAVAFLAIALALGGCMAPGCSGQKALMGVPLPGVGSKSATDDVTFRKRVEKDPFPSAGGFVRTKGAGG
jgi:hypothetical protein